MPDRRLRKTDEAIRSAFLRLLFSVRYETISMSRIAAEADVSRSTLYQHYSAREAVLEATMAGIIDDLADAMVGVANAARIDAVLVHFWENRRLSRAIFGPPVDAQVCRWLTQAIETRLRKRGRPTLAARIDAVPAAAGAIALLDQWMTGHLDASHADIASALVGCVGTPAR